VIGGAAGCFVFRDSSFGSGIAARAMLLGLAGDSRVIGMVLGYRMTSHDLRRSLWELRESCLLYHAHQHRRATTSHQPPSLSLSLTRCCSFLRSSFNHSHKRDKTEGGRKESARRVTKLPSSTSSSFALLLASRLKIY
jgi:hypothetical protein